ncbi:hypothetical protein HAX54_020906 [Datura stramonium]|uniref:Uncharacterized protein n=1 Tax=Datura stramonium TaxID=4076 RepID=A0ABS8S3C0_DATST|nr:hypothetical protein [Datura stramonium]
MAKNLLETLTRKSSNSPSILRNLSGGLSLDVITSTLSNGCRMHRGNLDRARAISSVVQFHGECGSGKNDRVLCGLSICQNCCWTPIKEIILPEALGMLTLIGEMLKRWEC